MVVAIQEKETQITPLRACLNCSMPRGGEAMIASNFEEVHSEEWIHSNSKFGNHSRYTLIFPVNRLSFSHCFFPQERSRDG
jgi:hypothetical protein